MVNPLKIPESPLNIISGLICPISYDFSADSALTLKSADLRAVFYHEKVGEQCINRSSQIRNKHES